MPYNIITKRPYITAVLYPFLHPETALGTGQEIVADEDETEDFAAQARKKLGIPEYDPNASLLATLPKILILGPTN